ncbi:hypothetical protein LPB86_04080 [Pedobacter sp. MC2016-14]|uniref:hypothetical protein n=1 Tax=Pedobacter sp. MC2016-14 TaxID=2897327 RepID=UPI001E643B0E|nr:hypothetical protein [Pedobacter sp. MC2016-14]MCD0487394.1 hypothetical protein [Pedobacter sp. MC2016-14]
MKKFIILISILTISAFQSCKKEDSPGDNYDFSNSIAPYVTIEALEDIEVAAGDVVDVTLQMRTSLQQSVTATYKVTGIINTPSATVVFPAEETEASASLTIPVNAAVGSTAVFTLVSAKTADGKSLTIGQNANSAQQTFTIEVVQ